MQITVTINETFNDADALADFADALRRMFAGTVATVRRPQLAAVPSAAVPAAPARAETPAPAAGEAVDGEEAPADAGPVPARRGRGRPKAAAANDAPASEPAAEAAGAVTAAVQRIAADAGATTSAAPAAEEITEMQFRAKLSELFKALGTKPWVDYLAANGGYANVGQILAAGEGETAVAVQARVRKFYTWIETALAAKPAK